MTNLVDKTKDNKKNIDLLDDSLNIDYKEELVNNISVLDAEQLKELNKVAQSIEKGEKFTVIPDDYKPKEKRRFIKMYDTFEDIIINSKSLNDLKVLMFLIKKMNDKTGEIIITNTIISYELKMDKSLVSKSIKNLINDELILIKSGYENKRNKIFLLNEKYLKYGR